MNGNQEAVDGVENHYNSKFCCDIRPECVILIFDVPHESLTRCAAILIYTNGGLIWLLLKLIFLDVLIATV